MSSALITASGQFGPFNSIDTLDDRYRCDGIDYPFTVIGEATIGEYVAPPAPPLTDDERVAIIHGYESAVQKFMDAEALKRGYDDIARAVTYADEPSVPRFQQEGQAFRAWRSLIWQKCIEVQNEALAGSISVPTVDELIALLPPLTGMPA